MSYIAQRMQSTLKHLRSLRGISLTASALTALGAIFSNGTISQVLSVAALGLAGALLLAMSLRLSEQHARLGALHRQQKKLAKRSRATAAPHPSQPVTRVGPNVDTQRDERVAQARRLIMEIRSGLATEDIPAASPQLTAADFADPSPVVTIVVPCYNESRFLATTLESVRRQTFTDWECVIVDDASTDRSVSEAHRYVKADRRFRLVRHKVNAGLSAARNTGLRVARGRLVTFLDSDDMLMADSLIDRVESFADAGEMTAGVYCGVRLVPEDASLDSLPAREDWGGGSYVDFVSAGAECPFNAHAPLLRTSIIRQVCGFDESMLDGAEDWNLWLRVMRRGYNFKPARWRTATYRQKHQSMAKVGAQAHVEEAQRQIALSYQHDPSVSHIPRSFPEPLPTYQRELVLARRAIQYAATAFARGDEGAATSILGSDEVRLAPWMQSHLSFDDVTVEGFRRAYGLGPQEIADLEHDIAPLKDRFAELLVAQMPPAPAVATDTDEIQYDVLFVPLNGAQAKAMLDMASCVGSAARCAFLNVDRVSGVQGAGEVIDASSVESFTINQWFLTARTYRDLIVSYPRDGLIAELIAATIESGGRVGEIAPDGIEVLLVDDRPEYDHKLDRVDEDTISEWLSGAPHVLSTPVRITGWNDVAEPDPDSAFLVEEYPDTLFDAEDIARFKDIHSGERCVIIGNGPSLNKLDLRKLASEYTIGVNGIFYAADEMGFDLTYYLVEDTMVMRDNVNEIKSYRAGHKFFPSIYRDQVGESDNVTYFMMNRGFYAATSPSFCIPRFSTDASQRLYSGQSVTIINLQLAYYMGFREVVLIGMDFSYTVPADAQIDGAHILSMGDDPNHFHPDYFGRGKIWKDPKLDRVLSNYQLAKLMYEADGRRIVNATAGGKLELFERVEYGKLFG